MCGGIFGGGGGGGATQSGFSGAGPHPQPQPSPRGNGGDGAPNTIHGCATPFCRTTFAGGGAGAGFNSGPHGIGGDGGGGNIDGNGAANSGGGAGAKHTPGGRDGGSGVVIVRFPGCASLSVSPGCNLTDTAGSCKVAVFKVSGTLTVS